MPIMDAISKLTPTFRDAPLPDKPARIARFEQRFFSPLPADYREFLEANGRMMFFPDNRVSPAADAKRQISLSSLYGLDDHRVTLETANEMYRGRLPPGVIAIGDSGGGGDLICLDVAGLDPGAVFDWDHEREVDAAGVRQPDYSNMSRLAGSFTELIERTSLVTGGSSGPPRVKKATLKF